MLIVTFLSIRIVKFLQNLSIFAQMYAFYEIEISCCPILSPLPMLDIN